VLSPEQLSAATAATPLLTAVWACGPVVAAAVQAGRFAGVLSGVVVTAVDAWVHGGFTTEVARDAVLLVATGFGFGLAATTARWGTEQLRRAARAEVATAERERVARSIHDSVLSVLSRMHAGDGRPDGDAEELTRLAGEQEIALRSLITTPAPGVAISGENDLGAALQELAGSNVEVSVPAAGVPLPAGDVEELVALTRVALADTARHAGPETKSWVLVEDLGDEVVLSVRDDGDADHRSDLSREIRDRIADLGGTLTRDAGPGRGAEWEVRLARTRHELHR
jgi:signal transduction histidine kinase